MRGTDQISHNISGHFSCFSSYTVYVIRCSKCSNAWYVGETSKILKRSMNAHRASLNNFGLKNAIPCCLNVEWNIIYEAKNEQKAD